MRAIKELAVAVVVVVSALAPVARTVHAHSRASITAKAAILIDNQTGEVLWERNPDLPLPPASTTKIVTAMLALRSGRLDDSMRVTSEAAQAPPSKISLRPGWKMRLRDLVYAVLLNSANDASVVIAEGLSGNVRDFAEHMNAEARVLGATHTHFVNPNGLPAADHYSTARDLATMFAHAMRDPLFRSIVSTKTTAVAPTAGSLKRITLRNHNRLLGNYRIQVVGKTGWTIAAKKCFVGAGMSDGRELGVAVLGSTDLWGDVKRLLEFGFDGKTLPDAEPASTQSAAPATGVAAGDAEPDVPTAPSALKYFVHLATFRTLSSATRLKNSVAANGYPAHVEKVHRGQLRRYRVVVGSYPTHREAEQAASKLKEAHPRSAAQIVARS